MINFNQIFLIITIIILISSLSLTVNCYEDTIVHDECGVSPTVFIERLAKKLGLTINRFYKLMETKYPKEYGYLKIKASHFHDCLLISDLSKGSVING
jgi:hypothetical protein